MTDYLSGNLQAYSPGTALYDRSLTVYGIKIVAGAEVSGNKAVPDDWVYKTARVVQLLLDPAGEGINSSAQENAIKILSEAAFRPEIYEESEIPQLVSKIEDEVREHVATHSRHAI